MNPYVNLILGVIALLVILAVTVKYFRRYQLQKRSDYVKKVTGSEPSTEAKKPSKDPDSLFS